MRCEAVPIFLNSNPATLQLLARTSPTRRINFPPALVAGLTNALFGFHAKLSCLQNETFPTGFNTTTFRGRMSELDFGNGFRKIGSIFSVLPVSPVFGSPWFRCAKKPKHDAFPIGLV